VLVEVLDEPDKIAPPAFRRFEREDLVVPQPVRSEVNEAGGDERRDRQRTDHAISPGERDLMIVNRQARRRWRRRHGYLLN